jgi:hypothetical protein
LDEVLDIPKTMDEAVDQIIAEFTLETANMTEEDLAILQAILAKFISEKLDEWLECKELYADCLNRADGELLDETDASTVIFRVLWDRLRQTHKLRVVK